MKLIQLLVIVQWVRLSSSRVFEVRTLGVARLLSTQIKLVSDHLRVCLSIRNCSRCLEALQKVREAGVRMYVCAHVLLSSPRSPTLNGENNQNCNLKRCECATVGLCWKADWACWWRQFSIRPGLHFYPWSLILGVMYAPCSIFSLNDEENTSGHLREQKDRLNAASIQLFTCCTRNQTEQAFLTFY